MQTWYSFIVRQRSITAYTFVHLSIRWWYCFFNYFILKMINFFYLFVFVFRSSHEEISNMLVRGSGSRNESVSCYVATNLAAQIWYNKNLFCTLSKIDDYTKRKWRKIKRRSWRGNFIIIEVGKRDLFFLPFHL